TLAADTTVLALNAMAGVQAAEICCDGTVAWGVQYHPEYSLKELAAIVRRTGLRLVEEGFFAAEGDLLHYADELAILDREPTNKPLAWRHGIDGAVLDRNLRVKEVANWIERIVLPTRAQRRRGRPRLVPRFRSSCYIAATLLHELRKQRGTSKSMVLVPLFDLKFLYAFAAGGVGTSNRRHQCPASAVRASLQHPLHELRKQRGTSKSMVLVPLFDLKFLYEFAAGGVGTSNRRH